MSMKARKKTLLAKVESTYGTDPTPTGVANAILISNMKVKPIEQNLVSRDLVRSWLGNSEQLVAASWKMIEFETEAAGSGAAGTAPPWGALMKGCAMGETVNAGVSVVYAPISTGEQSLTLYANIDGVNHKILGARGTFSVDLNAQQRPVIKWSFTGLFVAITDTALPSVTLSGWQKPQPVNNSNTSAFSLHGYSGILSALSISMNNEINYRNLVGTEDVQLTDRKPSGSISIEHPTIAAKDYYTGMPSATTGALSITHGSVAGNKFKIDAPNVQLTKPDNPEENGIVMLQMDMLFIPGGSGNDDLTFTAL